MAREMSKEELDQVNGERKYWEELSKRVGWRLYGWTFTHSATYMDRYNHTINLTGHQRDDLMRALEG